MPINRGWVATTIGATALLTTSMTAAALAWPDSGPSRLLNLGSSHEARAGRLLDDPNPSAAELARAQTETLRSLSAGPANATGWLRLAYIDSRRPTGLGATGIAALQRSYDAAPYGPDDTAWRLRFALSQWTRLDSATRQMVLAELRVALLHRSPAVRSLSQDVSDPAGRVAIQMTLLAAEPMRDQTQSR